MKRFLLASIAAFSLNIGHASAQSFGLSHPVMSNGSVPMSGPLSLGTSKAPLLMSTAPSQSGVTVNVLSPGTAGTPGPGSAHHGVNITVAKQGYYAGAPQVGELDPLNIVAFQDGSAANGADAGDMSGILSDLTCTLRAQDFCNGMEGHVGIVDTTNNTHPYYMDYQLGNAVTIGGGQMDGTQSSSTLGQQMLAFALIDGHGNGIKMVEQSDPSPQAGKLGHGYIDTIFEAGDYTGRDLYSVGRYGNIASRLWSVGGDGTNVNLSLGASDNPNGGFATATPYIDFNGEGAMQNVRLISDGPGQLSILNAGTRDYIFNANYAVLYQPTTFTQTVQVQGKIYLDSGNNVWAQETGGKVVIGTGSTNLFSINTSTGAVIAKGGFTSGTP